MSKTGAILQLMAKGGPFRVVQAPIPSPAADEIVLKLKAIALNPLDWKQMLSGMMLPSFPAVLGLEAAGIVETIGTNVNHVKPGDEVIARCSAGGKGAAYQEYPVLKTSNIALKPKDLNLQEASSFTIVGGSSAVGGAAIQILRMVYSDAVIVTTCSPSHFAKVVKLGANKAFDSKSASLIEDISAESSDGKFDAIVDAVNGVAAKPKLLDLLSGPRQFSELLTGANIDPNSIPKDVKHSLVAAGMLDPKPYAPNVLSSLTSLVNDGKYVPPVRVEVVGHGISEVEQGLRTLMKGVSGTKLVVTL